VQAQNQGYLKGKYNEPLINTALHQETAQIKDQMLINFLNIIEDSAGKIKKNSEEIYNSNTISTDQAPVSMGTTKHLFIY
jgi:hypothetical protein